VLSAKDAIKAGQIDYTRGFDVEPKHSSYKQKVKTTPAKKVHGLVNEQNHYSSLIRSEKLKNILMKLVLTGLNILQYCFQTLRRSWRI
jgi:hypothetical protein